MSKRKGVYATRKIVANNPHGVSLITVEVRAHYPPGIDPLKVCREISDAAAEARGKVLRGTNG